MSQPVCRFFVFYDVKESKSIEEEKRKLFLPQKSKKHRAP
jgi:hypothetical protein